MPIFARAAVVEVTSLNPGAQRVMVLVEGADRPNAAVAYPRLVGECAPGDEVLVNTTAIEFGLGTGGEHFVVANLTRCPASDLSGGHIMKLRYAPHQLDVLAAEESGSPLSGALAAAESLDDRSVIVLSLHSQLAAAAAVARRDMPTARVAFVMSDATALPLGVSRLVATLVEKRLLDVTVTCGQAFGGDVEAVNRYTGLLAAIAAGADIVVAGAGPGSVGTGTMLGHSGVDVGEWVNAVVALGGRPIVAPRISGADPRIRHRGLSIHTRAALGRVSLAGAVVAVPHMDDALAGMVDAAIEGEPTLRRHEWRKVGRTDALAAMSSFGLSPDTMGRPATAEEALFEAAGAAVSIALGPGG